MDDAVIVGIDEAGRGPLAGPVVAGAVVLTPTLSSHPLIRDSKQLNEAEREGAYEWIVNYCVYGVGMSKEKEIDELGILGATEKAMQQAVAEVAKQVTPTYLIVDGRDKFWFDYPHSSIIKGDQKEICISAASIIAKVTRDRLMIKYAQKHKKYGFEDHKGYGTPAHFEALKKHGPCSIHRWTYLHFYDFGTTPTPRRRKSEPKEAVHESAQSLPGL